MCGTKYVITEHLLRLLLGARPCQRKTCSSILVAVLSLLVTLQMQSLRHRDQREWIALCIPAPSSEKPLSTHILLDQESHFSHRMSLFNGKAWQMSNHVRSAISPLRFRVRITETVGKTLKLHSEKEASKNITQITLSKIIRR